MYNKYKTFLHSNAENNDIELVILSDIGERKEQQDSCGYRLKPNECIIAVSDGMGGHSGGAIASNLAVNSLLEAYSNKSNLGNWKDFFVETVGLIDKAVAILKDSAGNCMHAGATVASVAVSKRKLHWVSVGDSRIYILRDNEFVQITKDHNYKSFLDEKLNKGIISVEEYNEELRQGDALISFLGINGIPRIDVNELPFILKSNDRLLLMSDGLNKILSDEDIRNIIVNFSDINDAVKYLNKKVEIIAHKNKIKRDNMTIALLRVK